MCEAAHHTPVPDSSASQRRRVARPISGSVSNSLIPLGMLDVARVVDHVRQEHAPRPVAADLDAGVPAAVAGRLDDAGSRAPPRPRRPPPRADRRRPENPPRRLVRGERAGPPSRRRRDDDAVGRDVRRAAAVVEVEVRQDDRVDVGERAPVRRERLGQVAGRPLPLAVETPPAAVSTGSCGRRRAEDDVRADARVGERPLGPEQPALHRERPGRDQLDVPVRHRATSDSCWFRRRA